MALMAVEKPVDKQVKNWKKGGLPVEKAREQILENLYYPLFHRIWDQSTTFPQGFQQLKLACLPAKNKFSTSRRVYYNYYRFIIWKE